MGSQRLVRFDWAIKSILRDKANFDILEGFLTALLGYDIFIEQILESESNQAEEQQKYNRVDILVKDQKDQRFIIEVQTEMESDYLERLLFGTCKTVVENLKIGEPFKNIKKVISISIMFFNLGGGKDYLYHGKTEFVGVHTGEVLEVKHLVNITDENNRVVRKFETKNNIYPEYYLIEVERFEDVIREEVDEWIYFFKNETIEENFKSKNIQLLKKKLNTLAMDDIARKNYEKYLMNLASERDIFETAREEGITIGLAKGEVKGRIEGRLEGKIEGRLEGRLEGKIEDILEALSEKGEVPVGLEKRIREQTDITVLKKWFILALAAETVEGFAGKIG